MIEAQSELERGKLILGIGWCPKLRNHFSAALSSFSGSLGAKDAAGSAQHDEVEPNFKKILHRNGIWGLEAIAMKFHLPI